MAVFTEIGKNSKIYTEPQKFMNSQINQERNKNDTGIDQQDRIDRRPESAGLWQQCQEYTK